MGVQFKTTSEKPFLSDWIDGEPYFLLPGTPFAAPLGVHVAIPRHQRPPAGAGLRPRLFLPGPAVVFNGRLPGTHWQDTTVWQGIGVPGRNEPSGWLQPILDDDDPLPEVWVFWWTGDALLGPVVPEPLSGGPRHAEQARRAASWAGWHDRLALMMHRLDKALWLEDYFSSSFGVRGITGVLRRAAEEAADLAHEKMAALTKGE